eukprot:ANDGO_06120.mRNA.1 hypothetical protein
MQTLIRSVQRFMASEEPGDQARQNELQCILCANVVDMQGVMSSEMSQIVSMEFFPVLCKSIGAHLTGFLENPDGVWTANWRAVRQQLSTAVLILSRFPEIVLSLTVGKTTFERVVDVLIAVVNPSTESTRFTPRTAKRFLEFALPELISWIEHITEADPRLVELLCASKLDGLVDAVIRLCEIHPLSGHPSFEHLHQSNADRLVDVQCRLLLCIRKWVRSFEDPCKHLFPGLVRVLSSCQRGDSMLQNLSSMIPQSPIGLAIQYFPRNVTHVIDCTIGFLDALLPAATQHAPKGCLFKIQSLEQFMTNIKHSRSHTAHSRILMQSCEPLLAFAVLARQTVSKTAEEAANHLLSVACDANRIIDGHHQSAVSASLTAAIDSLNSVKALVHSETFFEHFSTLLEFTECPSAISTDPQQLDKEKNDKNTNDIDDDNGKSNEEEEEEMSDEKGEAADAVEDNRNHNHNRSSARIFKDVKQEFLNSVREITEDAQTVSSAIEHSFQRIAEMQQQLANGHSDAFREIMAHLPEAVRSIDPEAVIHGQFDHLLASVKSVILEETPKLPACVENARVLFSTISSLSDRFAATPFSNRLANDLQDWVIQSAEKLGSKVASVWQMYKSHAEVSRLFAEFTSFLSAADGITKLLQSPGNAWTELIVSVESLLRESYEGAVASFSGGALKRILHSLNFEILSVKDLMSTTPFQQLLSDPEFLLRGILGTNAMPPLNQCLHGIMTSVVPLLFGPQGLATVIGSAFGFPGAGILLGTLINIALRL